MDKRITHSPQTPQQAASDEDVPVDVRRAATGEIVVWTPKIRSRVRPLVTIGQFADGQAAAHFRCYKVSSNGIATMTRGGASFRVAELVEIVERLKAVFDVIPSLRTEGR